MVEKSVTEQSKARRGARLTIDELAHRVDMTVRNLREWRGLGLLPPAEMEGRVGYYDEGVVTRIEEIKKLQSEGFTLGLIARLLDAGGDSAVEVLRLAGALRAPFREEAPPLVDRAEWGERWGPDDPDAGLERARELGLVRERTDGRLEFASARAAAVGEALLELGLSPSQVLDATTEIRERADGIAELFERVWREHIWDPFVEAGMPEERLDELQGTLAKVQPLALDAVIAIFTIAMEARIEQGIALEVGRALQGSGEGP